MPENTTLKIEKLVYGGDGLARLDGRVVFVPYVLPGELVSVELKRAKNDLLRGRLLEVVEPAPERVDAPCPYFGRCGGCQYQHAPYEFQLQQKTGILREILLRVGKIAFNQEIATLSGAPWQYRNRIQLHIEKGKVGYFEAGSHALCPIDQCPISSPRLNDAIAALGRDLPHFRWFDATLELFTNETEVQVNVVDRVPSSVRPMLATLGTVDPIHYDGFRVSRNSFFQVNRFLVDALVGAATADLSGNLAVDLYAGVGLFSLALAKAFKQVVAVESGWSAFRDLEFNASSAEGRVTPRHQTTEDFLREWDSTPDVILADPPRTGLGKQVVADLVRIASPHIVIVSCDPATLARDLQALIAGGYLIDRLTLVDLFPQTGHLETVAALSRAI